jgi:cold shock protein
MDAELREGAVARFRPTVGGGCWCAANSEPESRLERQKQKSPDIARRGSAFRGLAEHSREDVSRGSDAFLTDLTSAACPGVRWSRLYFPVRINLSTSYCALKRFRGRLPLQIAAEFICCGSKSGGDKMAKGTVKWFNPTKGYGFIQPQGGGKDVFVHISAVERAGLSTLNEGQVVQYEVVANRGKESAENLKVG